MLDHLLDFEPPVFYLDNAETALPKAPPDALLDAQVSTADWLDAMGAPTPGEAERAHAQAAAQAAFGPIVAGAAHATQTTALLALKTPAAVRHLTGMLTAYDWEFVEQAQQIRGYAVSQLLEEVKHPDARIRLRALELLGRVTEVALFTDRVEVKKTTVTDAELDAKIKQKLSRFMDITDTPSGEIVDIAARNEAS